MGIIRRISDAGRGLRAGARSTARQGFSATGGPYPYVRAGHLGVPALLPGVGASVDLAAVPLEEALEAGLDFVTVSAGGPERIAPQVRELLTRCEELGVPTVMQVGSVEDLQTPTAAVVSHAVTRVPELEGELQAQLGPERSALLPESVDPARLLRSHTGRAEPPTPEEITRTRELIATASPGAVADRLMGMLRLPVEPGPLVTVLLIHRRPEHLPNALANLQRQVYERVDPLVVVDPLYAEDVREELADWPIPVRVEVSEPRSLLQDRLNIGIQHALGEYVAIFEESHLYGSHYLVDLVQAAQHTGAELVGKASWWAWDGSAEGLHVKNPEAQWSTEAVPATGAMMVSRQAARSLGIIRRAKGSNGPLARRLREAGGSILSVHPYDLVVPEGDQSWRDVPVAELADSAFVVAFGGTRATDLHP